MINIKENEKLNILNHSCAHLLAHAVKHLYPNAKFWVGPVIDSGFYYDIDLGDDVIKEEDLPKIEKEMKKISKGDKYINRIELSKKEALDMFKDDPYKIDLIERMDEDDTVISAYKQDDFIDLCRGPHMPTTKSMKYFKLLKVSGAYWKNDAKNKMLQRIYGVCFENEEDFLKSLEKQKELDSMEKAVRLYDNKTIEVDAKLSRYDREVLSLKHIDTLEIEENKKNLTAKKEEIDKKIIEYSYFVTNNKTCLQNISGGYEEYVILEKEYQITKELSGVANGNLEGKAKQEFVTYVLAYHFEKILQMANIRLNKMSNGRYEFLRPDYAINLQSAAGLDLEVFDTYTGKCRSAKTLSGGESFKASLALALGLSEVVSNRAGGVQIETLFIDEGFGSLDSESLEQAIGVLNDLKEGNRLIGIISHVNELKEKINNKIVIKKGSNGSSLSIVL